MLQRVRGARGGGIRGGRQGVQRVGVLRASERVRRPALRRVLAQALGGALGHQAERTRHAVVGLCTT
jgi:hypothetical protein